MIKDDEEFAKVGLDRWLHLLAYRSSFSKQMKPVLKELMKYVYFDGQPNADMKNATYVVERFIEVNDLFLSATNFQSAIIWINFQKFSKIIFSARKTLRLKNFFDNLKQLFLIWFFNTGALLDRIFAF